MGTAQSTVLKYAPDDLDVLIGEFFPDICGARPRRGDDFLIDPATLEGSTRHYYVEYLRWLGLNEEILPPERILIHAGLPDPGRLECRTPQGQEGRFLAVPRQGLYRSLDAVKMVLAHELTHLYLVRHGHQKLRDAGRTTTVPAPTVSQLSDPEEIRTEIASILLGFGRLALNGVCDYTRLHAEDGLTGQLGYLLIPGFVHVYRRVDELVGVGPESAARGLNGPARQALTTTP